MQPMQLAIERATQGILAFEGGPFGASIVKDDQVIAVANNTVLKDRDPTAHAEINAIRIAATTLNTHVLEGCTLYTTAEPCPMCLAAIYWAEKVVIGVEMDLDCPFWVSYASFISRCSELHFPWTPFGTSDFMCITHNGFMLYSTFCVRTLQASFRKKFYSYP